jgi:hypothetical protein
MHGGEVVWGLHFLFGNQYNDKGQVHGYIQSCPIV